MLARLLPGLLLATVPLLSAPRRVLFVTHTAGFRHGSVEVSHETFDKIAARTGVLEIQHTEDVSLLTASVLQNFDAVFFFTSGELPISTQQKSDLLAFVRDGKGFGGAHSATDTLYTWPEYGEMIGAVFDGHPWAHEVTIDVEDPTHPATRAFPPSFRISDEIYQFRSFSRERVRVLMTLDTRSVNMKAEGINRTDGDFALAWTRSYGKGRVFYTALGHGDETWLDPRFQTMLENALLWLTGEVEADGAPRSASPVVASTGSAAPGALVTISGTQLTSGSSMRAESGPWPIKLAGTSVLLNGAPVPLLSVAPSEVVAQVPFDASTGDLSVVAATTSSATRLLTIDTATPSIVATQRSGSVLVLYATGLGAVQPEVKAGAAAPMSPLSQTVLTPSVSVGDRPAAVFFSGLVPSLVALYQVNVTLPDGATGSTTVTLEIGGRRASVSANLDTP